MYVDVWILQSSFLAANWVRKSKTQFQSSEFWILLRSSSIKKKSKTRLHNTKITYNETIQDSHTSWTYITKTTCHL